MDTHASLCGVWRAAAKRLRGSGCAALRALWVWRMKAPQAARAPGRKKGKNKHFSTRCLDNSYRCSLRNCTPTYTSSGRVARSWPPLRLGCSCSSETLCPDRRPWADTVHVDSIGSASIRPTASSASPRRRQRRSASASALASTHTRHRRRSSAVGVKAGRRTRAQTRDARARGKKCGSAEVRHSAGAPPPPVPTL